MRKLFVIALLAILLIAADLPPALPSSFWGYVSGASVGQTVTATVAGHVTTTRTFAYQGRVVYALDATGGTDGQVVAFAVGGVRAGTATYRTGTSVRVDLAVRAVCRWC